jgi:hypothetical protein
MQSDAGEDDSVGETFRGVSDLLISKSSLLLKHFIAPSLPATTTSPPGVKATAVTPKPAFVTLENRWLPSESSSMQISPDSEQTIA